MIFPEKNSDEINLIVSGMWENIGRTIGEYVHIRNLDPWGEKSPIEFVNAEIIDQLRDDGKPAILFLGHISNWEYATFGALKKGMKIAQLFRKSNNPWVANLIGKVYGGIAQELIPKGAQGARRCLEVLRRGDHLSMMVDQKLNQGILVPFLGVDAMTPTALAKFALRFDCPVVPVRVERLAGVRCRVTYYPPLELPREGTEEEKIFTIMLRVNQYFSDWIRERPQDWMWFHNRWPKKSSPSS